MKLVFQGGKEIVMYDIDRAAKTLKIATSKTNYELRQVNWKLLFDKGKETVQDKLLESYDDETFKNVIIVSMANQGYVPKEGNT